MIEKKCLPANPIPPLPIEKDHNFYARYFGSTIRFQIEQLFVTQS